MVLGMTDTLKPTLQLYTDWIRKFVEDVEIVSLSCIQQNLSELDRCDGLVLTGGGDIHPKFYGREDAMPLVSDVNERRDEFEFAVIQKGLDKRLPVLGICRGMQVLNVALGGSLIPDLGDGIHRGIKGSKLDVRHAVEIDPGSIVQSIVGTTGGEVNSHHHQAVDRIGDGLRITVRSTDGIVEGLEWEHPSARPFLLLVQWHPERMEDPESLFSNGLLKRFVREVRSSNRVQQSTT